MTIIVIEVNKVKEPKLAIVIDLKIANKPKVAITNEEKSTQQTRLKRIKDSK